MCGAYQHKVVDFHLSLQRCSKVLYKYPIYKYGKFVSIQTLPRIFIECMCCIVKNRRSSILAFGFRPEKSVCESMAEALLHPSDDLRNDVPFYDENSSPSERCCLPRKTLMTSINSWQNRRLCVSLHPTTSRDQTEASVRRLQYRRQEPSVQTG